MTLNTNKNISIKDLSCITLNRLEKYRLGLMKENKDLYFFLCNEEVKAGNNRFVYNYKVLKYAFHCIYKKLLEFKLFSKLKLLTFDKSVLDIFILFFLSFSLVLIWLLIIFVF